MLHHSPIASHSEAATGRVQGGYAGDLLRLRMLVWQKRAGREWLGRHEEALLARMGTRLAIVHLAGQKTALLEVAGHRRELKKLRAQFGGVIASLPADWLQRAQQQQAKPIRIGKRLVIVRQSASAVESMSLVIPAGAAFGTGEHATTAMSLRLLEQVSRKLRPCWSMLDLGCGSAILALAARKFGAGKVVAIDFDRMAISTAKANARLNRMNGIEFRVADVRKFAAEQVFDVVTANLFGQLLIEILPELKHNRSLIFSGILREQERELLPALKRNGTVLIEHRRRGKWTALLCVAPEHRRSEKI
ncbi:MAG: 50S ribosomal protein L11 methyltransferase [Chthoniobacterales bacterium]